MLEVILTLNYSHAIWNSLLDWLASVLAHPELGLQTCSATPRVYEAAEGGSEQKSSRASTSQPSLHFDLAVEIPFFCFGFLLFLRWGLLVTPVWLHVASAVATQVLGHRHRATCWLLL